MKNIVVVDEVLLNAGQIARLHNLGKVTVHKRLSEEQIELANRLAGAHIVLVSELRLDAELLETTNKLEMISLWSSGYDHVDVQTAAERNITVCNTPACTATAIAEHFRDTGKHVLLVMDSLSRFASAQREIGLANGEPSTTRGYPPSVFAQLPKLVERAGCTQRGTITGCYAVLVEGDNLNEPVSDCVRSLLDGHIVLSRELAARDHYPAIDVLGSLSRLMPQVATAGQRESASALRDMLAVLAEYKDLIAIGAYRQGTNPRLDSAICCRDELDHFLRQGLRLCAEPRRTQEWAFRIAEKYRAGCACPSVAAVAGTVLEPEN